MLRFLPSFVVFAILLIVLIFEDLAQTKIVINERRDVAGLMLQDVHDQLSQHLSNTLRSADSLVARMDSPFDIDHSRFETFVNNTLVGTARLVRAEFAPGFKTRLVAPYHGNEGLVGKHPIPVSPRLPRETGFNLSRNSPGAVAVQVNKLGHGKIQVRREIRVHKESEIIITGLLYLAVEFNLAVTNAPKTGPLSDVELLYFVHKGDTPRPNIPVDWQPHSSLRPILTSTNYPWGDYLTYMRPVVGWQPQGTELLLQRLKLAILGLLVLLPIVLANWFAISKEMARGRLSKTEAQLGRLLKDLPGAALVVTWPVGATKESDEDMIVFLDKKACFDVWGVEAKDVEADIRVLRALHEGTEETVRVHETVEESAVSLRSWHAVWPIVTPTGEHRWLEGHGHPTRLSDGSLKWSSFVVNATEQVHRQQELERQRGHTEKLQRLESIGRLTGGVAHDFNNILAIVLGNLEILLNRETDAGKRDTLEVAINATLRGSELTRNMLAFSRQAPLEAKVLDLNDVLRSSKNWVVRTIRENIIIESSFLAGLWKVKADESSTVSAFLNLVVNARDAMPSGGKITVETSNVRIDNDYIELRGEDIEPGRYVLVAISDTGIGIPAHEIEQVFEPYFTTKDPGDGTGLGLSMVVGFMKQSGGALRVYSEVGVGTTFKLYFPALTGAKYSPPKIETPIAKLSKDAKLLLVEDESQILTVLSAVLSREGYSITIAKSGDEAAELFAEHPDFDIVITDIVMPGKLQGTTLSRHLRELRPELPVIFMSGYASEATVHGNGLRPEDIRLMKPVRKRDLIEAIEKALAISNQ